MRRGLLIWIMLLLAMPLLGGAAKPEPMPREPTADEALVVVYRPFYRPGSARALYAKFNDVPTVKLGVSQHTWLYMKPGSYWTDVAPPWDLDYNTKHTSGRKELEGGKTYIFAISVELHSLYPVSSWSFWMDEKDTATARAEMYPITRPKQRSKYRPPEPVFTQLGALAE
jgi:hypothetical protein